jgi:hypothetical protein
VDDSGTPTGGDWDSAFNWTDATTNTNHVPTASDAAVISSTYANVLITHSTGASDSVTSVTSPANFSLSGGSLAIGTTGQFSHNFTLTGASSVTLSGSGTVTMSGSTTWSGGTMGGAGLTILQGTTFFLGGTLDTRTLNNSSTFTLTDATLNFLNGATVNNQSGALFDMISSATFAAPVDLLIGQGSFNNSGTLRSSTSQTNDISLSAFTNNGTVTIQSGTLQLFPQPGGSSTLTNGSLINGPGTFQLNNNATLTVTGNSTIGCGAFNLGNNTILGNITLTGSGTTTVTGAFSWVAGTMSGTGLTILSGSSTISGTPTLNTRTLNNLGTVADSATMTVTNGAVISNESGATWTFLPNTGFTGAGAFNNFSTISDSVTLTVANGAVINNEGGATWNLLGNASIGGSGTFNNLGVLADGSTAPITLRLLFNNSGLVNVQSGALTVAGDGTDSGTFTVAGGTTLTFTAGSDTFANGAVVNGAGTFAGSGNETMTVVGSVSVATASFAFDGSSITGPGTLNVNSVMTWHNGNMRGSGVTNLRGGLSLQGSPSILDTRTLNNFGTATDAGALTLANGAIVNNESGATWNLPGFSSMSGGVFNNLGTLQSSGTDSVTVTLNNSGTFNVQSGTIFGNSVVANAGTVTLSGGAMLEVMSFTQTAGKLAGGGTLSVINGAMINGGIVSPGSSPGILDIQGNYTQNANSALNIEIDGPTAVSQYSVLAVSGTATLGGTLNILRPTSFIPAAGRTFQIVTAGAVSGTFATVNGLSIKPSEFFTITYNGANVVLRADRTDQLGVMNPAANGAAVWTLYNDITASTTVTTFTFGLATDTPLVGDWGGLGFTTVGVVRATPSGVFQWSLDTNGDHVFDAGDSVNVFGRNTDVPILGDWIGNGTTKIGVVRQLADGAAQWSLDSNGDGTFDSGDMVITYGLATDRFGAGHWTGPGKDELAVVRAGPGGTAEWILNTTGTGVFSSSDTIYTFGLATDQFLVGDWNGDGRTKIGVARPGPNGTMVLSLDTNGDGVFDAGDQVLTIPASAVGSIQFGNWSILPALTAADGPANAPAAALQLDATFQADVSLAINLWAQAGLNDAGLAQLRGLTYSVASLDGASTGLDIGNLIVLDATAAGHGWSEGPTPQPGQIDLVTTLAHEMGHALGLGHSPDPNDVMFETLPTGVRRTPTSADVSELLTPTVARPAP